VKLGGILEAGRKTTSRPGSDLPFFVERLKLLVERFQTRSQHILIIDGFDDLLRRRHLQYDALGALIFEALRLNSLFLRKGVPAKLIVLCRTDLYERLPGPNNNKIRQDYSCLLEWCEPGEHSRNSPLIRLINHRAGLRVRGDIDVFRTFLPATVGKGLDIRDHLLAHTRHVPRDIVMLFKFLQEYSGDEPMTEGQIFDALAAYSKRYFVQEIKDELDGQIDAEDITRAFRLLTSVRKRVTRLKELEERAVKLRFPEDFDVESVLRLLFECSAVGNGRIGSTDPQSAVFKFRNRFSSFEEGQYVVAHRALWEGLDLH
jgi:hypothetical protein